MHRLFKFYAVSYSSVSLDCKERIANKIRQLNFFFYLIYNGPLKAYIWHILVINIYAIKV